MSGNKDLRRAKHEAYQKKQAAKGEKVIKWIFIGLIVLGILFAIYATTLVESNEWIRDRKKIPR